MSNSIQIYQIDETLWGYYDEDAKEKITRPVRVETVPVLGRFRGSAAGDGHAYYGYVVVHPDNPPQTIRV